MATLSVEPNPAVTFKLRHADDDVIVIEKPARVPTQPGKGHTSDTLLNGLFAHYGTLLQNLGAARDFGLLHRLDKDTSGLLLIALRPRAYDALRAAFEARKVSKFYWAVCAKPPRTVTGVIRLPIVETHGGQEGRNRPKTAHIARMGKAALTAYRVLDASALAALIEARPITGRLHQVRVHLDAIGSPILGDEFYGPRSNRDASARLALHSHRLVFDHPVTGAGMDIRSPWPGDLRSLLTRVGLRRPDLAADSAPALDAGLETGAEARD